MPIWFLSESFKIKIKNSLDERVWWHHAYLHEICKIIYEKHRRIQIVELELVIIFTKSSVVIISLWMFNNNNNYNIIHLTESKDRPTCHLVKNAFNGFPCFQNWDFHFSGMRIKKLIDCYFFFKFLQFFMLTEPFIINNIIRI